MNAILDFADDMGFAETMVDEARNMDLKNSYTMNEVLNGRDWGHESDFQFDDDGEYGDDMPF